MKNIFILFALFALATACKKSSPPAEQPKTQSTNNTTSPTITNTVSPVSYSISFTDATAKAYTLSPTIQLALKLYPSNANTEFGTWISTTGTSLNSGYVYLAFPVDSSDVGKVLTNTNYPIQYHKAYAAQTIPDNKLGCLSFLMTGTAGTDSTVSNAQTSTYYHTITSIQYVGRKYDAVNMIISPQYVITGVFNANIRNDVTQQSRVFSNGQYCLLLGCRAQ